MIDGIDLKEADERTDRAEPQDDAEGRLDSLLILSWQSSPSSSQGTLGQHDKHYHLDHHGSLSHLHDDGAHRNAPNSGTETLRGWATGSQTLKRGSSSVVLDLP